MASVTTLKRDAERPPVEVMPSQLGALLGPELGRTGHWHVLRKSRPLPVCTCAPLFLSGLPAESPRPKGRARTECPSPEGGSEAFKAMGLPGALSYLLLNPRAVIKDWPWLPLGSRQVGQPLRPLEPSPQELLAWRESHPYFPSCRPVLAEQRTCPSQPSCLRSPRLGWTLFWGPLASSPSNSGFQGWF